MPNICHEFYSVVDRLGLLSTAGILELVSVVHPSGLYKGKLIAPLRGR